jgi:hypothetical protein
MTLVRGMSWYQRTSKTAWSWTLKLYRRMCGPDNGGVKPNAVTLVDMFSYAQLGTCNVGLDVERYVRERINGMVNYDNKTFNRFRLLRMKNILRETTRE